MLRNHFIIVSETNFSVLEKQNIKHVLPTYHNAHPKKDLRNNYTKKYEEFELSNLAQAIHYKQTTKEHDVSIFYCYGSSTHKRPRTQNLNTKDFVCIT